VQVPYTLPLVSRSDLIFRALLAISLNTNQKCQRIFSKTSDFKTIQRFLLEQQTKGYFPTQEHRLSMPSLRLVPPAAVWGQSGQAAGCAPPALALQQTLRGHHVSFHSGAWSEVISGERWAKTCIKMIVLEYQHNYIISVLAWIIIKDLCVFSLPEFPLTFWF
jgi:hypothetical protein